jgi:hypothetical protein
MRVSSPTPDSRGQMTEDGRQMTEDRGRTIDEGGQKMESRRTGYQDIR